MLGFIKNLEFIYDNTVHREKVVQNFYSPCLKNCFRYDRSAAFYSSTSLLTFIDSLEELVNGKKKIRLIIRKDLSEYDRKIILDSHDKDKIQKILLSTTEDLLSSIISLREDETDLNARSKILSWLIAKNIVEIKIGIPIHFGKISEYHSKYGIFFFDGAEVAFSGSANESLRGHLINDETITIFRKYENESSQHLEILKEKFEQDWNNENEFLKVEKPNKNIIDKITDNAPDDDIQQYLDIIKKAKNTIDIQDTYLNPPDLYKWQIHARREFIDNQNNGILNIATGCGKTFAGLAIAAELFSDEKIDHLIICTEKKELLNQWYNEIKKWKKERSRTNRINIFRNYGKYKELGSCLIEMPKKCTVLAIGYHEYHKLIDKLLDSKTIDLERILFIHDEVHNFSKEKQIMNRVKDKHSKFKFKLGLSATVYHQYDDEKNNFIKNEIGNVIYEYSLKDAIHDGLLSPFNYLIIPYSLTSEEKTEKSKRFGAYERDLKNKIKPKLQLLRELFIDLSIINKKAINKTLNFLNVIQKKEYKVYLKKCFIFALLSERANHISNELKQNTNLSIGTYYNNANESVLKNFNNGVIDNLIICEMLSEGISINDLQNVVLFDGTSGRRDVIQRIGRCLRKDPNNPDKIANVFDFIEEDTLNGEGDDSDKPVKISKKEHKRLNWLSSIAKNTTVLKI